MTVIVDPYLLLEKNSSKLKLCNECDELAVWEVSEQLAATPKTGYACAKHVDTVLYLVNQGIIDMPRRDPEGEL